MSEDLDEILELSDRIAVMSEGKIAYTTDAAGADRATIGPLHGGALMRMNIAGPDRELARTARPTPFETLRKGSAPQGEGA